MQDSINASGGSTSLNGFGININTINSDFVGNKLSLNNSYATTLTTPHIAQGGALYTNMGKIQNINGDFLGNSVTINREYPSGLYNYGYKHEMFAKGGAIYNDSDIGIINSNFINNSTNASGVAKGIYYDYVSGTYVSFSDKIMAKGGAVYNNWNIDQIKGNFINNSSFSKDKFVYSFAGAIYNQGNIKVGIDANFYKNYAYSTDQFAFGGAIVNYDPSRIDGKIGYINGDFMENYAYGKIQANGGAIYNDTASIGNINGNFYNNYVFSDNASPDINDISLVRGGAIFNEYKSKIGDIKGDFIGNYALVKTNATTFSAIASGGAIYSSAYSGYNTASIGNITGNFYNNYAKVETPNNVGSAQGGVIYNEGATIGDIKGNFINNYVQGGTTAKGGAIFNDKYNSNIKEINGDFIKNFAETSSTSEFASGGAIATGTYIGELNSNFAENHVKSGYIARGGAITNAGKIDKINGIFQQNFAEGGESAAGGAISNNGYIEKITGAFSENSASGTNAYGGAIYNTRSLTDISANLNNNKALASTGDAYGGALYSYQKQNSTNGVKYKSWNEDFINIGPYYQPVVVQATTTSFNNSIFENNTAVSENGNAFGGAIANITDNVVINFESRYSFFRSKEQYLEFIKTYSYLKL